MRKLFILPVAVVAIWAGAAHANSTASVPANSSTSSSSDLLQTMRKKTRATYLLEVLGARTKTLSGNTGDGTNITLNHYLGLSYKIGSKWGVGVTQSAGQIINENPNDDPLVFKDPYVTFSNSNIWSSQRYGTSLTGYIRYYAPISRNTQRAVDAASRNEAGKGSIRMVLTPSKSFMDGNLTISASTLLQYRMSSRTNAQRIAANGDPFRNDMIFLMTPTVEYSFTPKISGYLEYGFDMTHSTRGSLFTKWGTYKTNDYVSPGANIQVTKRLFLNPYLDFPPALRDTKDMGISLTAIYSLM